MRLARWLPAVHQPALSCARRHASASAQRQVVPETDEDGVIGEDVADELDNERHPHWEDMRAALLLELEDKKARANALLAHTPDPLLDETAILSTSLRAHPQSLTDKRPVRAVTPTTIRDEPRKPMTNSIATTLPRISISSSPSSVDPMVSRHDWRLSAPLIRRRSKADPPDLRDAHAMTTAWSGFNQLVGVGLPPALESRRPRVSPVPPTTTTTVDKGKAKELTVKEENWGWKVAVPPSERQDWPEADPYIQRMERLLELTAKADEAIYLEWLKKRGTPEQRQREGITVVEAVGNWLSADGGSGNGNGKSAMCLWERADGFPIELGENCYFELDRPLRFTSISDDADSRQGNLVDTRDGKLVVAFDIEWEMQGLYRIDVGIDDASLKLQRKALENLHFDPTHQKKRNDMHVESAQQSFLKGIVTPLREWTLQGTALRQRLVPTAAGVEEAGKDERVKPLFRENQLINSWIKRYNRDEPLVMPGDPVLRLNTSQLRAVAMALQENLSLIQGPPGTGKSATIVALIKLLKHHFRVPEPILLAAPTHVSTDHLLSMLVEAGLSPLRIGKADRVSPDLRQWTIEQRRTEHPLYQTSEDARLEAELSRIERNRSQEEIKSAKTRTQERRLRETYELADARYRAAVRKAYVFEHRLLSSLMTTADVFLGTTIGAGASTALRVVDFPIVIIDEAAMCTEPATLLPLMKGSQHVTLIGDHMQLPPVVIDKSAQEEKLQVSLFERLMRTGVPSTLLNTQYRMRPIVSGFPNFAFYDSDLQDDASVSSRTTQISSAFFDSGTDMPCVFVSHSYPDAYADQSMHNKGEANVIASIVRDLLKRNPSLEARSIGIISPYAGQTRVLRDLFSKSRLADVEINTVDGFQGREKEIIVLSTVRSNKRGHIGFLTDKRRLNVALTRARDALFVVGNETTLRKARDIVSLGPNGNASEQDENADAGMWSVYLDWMAKRGLIKEWEEYKV